MHRHFFVEDRTKPGIITRGIQTTHRAGVLRTVNQGRKMKGMLVPALLGVLMVCRVQVSIVLIQKRKTEISQTCNHRESIVSDNFFSTSFDDNFYFFTLSANKRQMSRATRITIDVVTTVYLFHEISLKCLPIKHRVLPVKRFTGLDRCTAMRSFRVHYTVRL